MEAAHSAAVSVPRKGQIKQQWAKKWYETENEKKEKTNDGCGEQDEQGGEDYRESVVGVGEWGFLYHLPSPCEEKAFQFLIKTFTVLSKQKQQGKALDWITRFPRRPGEG